MCDANARVKVKPSLSFVCPTVLNEGYGDGVDGAPNGISVPRWSLSKPHLKGSRPWASLSGISLVPGGLVIEQEDTMPRLALIVIFTALSAGGAANAQSDGGYVAPELSKPTPGHLLDQDYLTSTGETDGPAFLSHRAQRRSTARSESRITGSITASATVADRRTAGGAAAAGIGPDDSRTSS
jgi:hypothetical protein